MIKTILEMDIVDDFCNCQFCVFKRTFSQLILICRNMAMLNFLEQVKMARAEDEDGGMLVFYSMFSVAF